MVILLIFIADYDQVYFCLFFLTFSLLLLFLLILVLLLLLLQRLMYLSVIHFATECEMPDEEPECGL